MQICLLVVNLKWVNRYTYGLMGIMHYSCVCGMWFDGCNTLQLSVRLHMGHI
jgi:hypothetical protein